VTRAPSVKSAEQDEVYVSTDVETDGPLPGVNSMVSLASAAFAADGALIATFSRNLETIPGGVADPRTMAFWAGEPMAWAAVTQAPRPPAEVMAEYATWLRGLGEPLVFVGLPAVFDFGFVNHYLLRYLGTNPFGRNAVDIRSFAMGVLGASWQRTRFRYMPEEWVTGWVHDHTALGDALAQSRLFMRVREAAGVLGGGCHDG